MSKLIDHITRSKKLQRSYASDQYIEVTSEYADIKNYKYTLPVSSRDKASKTAKLLEKKVKKRRLPKRKPKIEWELSDLKNL